MIPKIIHYCWLSAQPIPAEFHHYMASWREKLPDYEFKLWNFTNFDKNSSAWVSEAFDNKKYAFAADYIRLYAVYNYGGIYLDMDVELIKSFDLFLDSSLMMAYEDEDGLGIDAGCFGAERHNSFIKECLDHYEARHFINDDGSFDMKPLPKIIKAVAQKHPEIEFYTNDFFTVKSTKTGQIEKTDNSVAIHHFAGSWVPKWQKYGRKIVLFIGGEKLKKLIKQLFHLNS